MMKRLLTIGLFLCGIVQAQDVHFSQYNLSPMILNPALAGFNACDYRVYLNGRTQWNTISGWNTYRTIAGGGDFTIGKVTKLNSFAGLGVSFYSDQAGDLQFMNNRAEITFAYHFMLTRKADMSISAGVQAAFNHRGFDPSKATYDNQYNPVTGDYDGTIPGETYAKQNLFFGDAGIGLLYNYTSRQKHNLYFGFSFNHVNQPKISFRPNGQDESSSAVERLYFKTTIHGGGLINIGKSAALMPTFMILLQGPSQEYNVGLNTKFRLSHLPYKSAALGFGVHYRVLDAVVVNARLDIKGFTMAFSYDINVSKLTPASNTFGAPEIALMYQGCFNRKPRPGNCPEL